MEEISRRHNITIYNDNNDVIQGNTSSLASLARAILEAVENGRASSLLTMWGMLRIENVDVLKDEAS